MSAPLRDSPAKVVKVKHGRAMIGDSKEQIREWALKLVRRREDKKKRRIVRLLDEFDRIKNENETKNTHDHAR